MPLSQRLEFAVEIPVELGEELEKKLAYICEGVLAASYDPTLRCANLTMDQSWSGSEKMVEARIQEVAAKLTASFRSGSRRSLARRERSGFCDAVDPHPILTGSGELKAYGRGRFGLGPKVTGLVQALDELILTRFAAFAAEPHQFPSLISGEVLHRCRYLKNFPASLTLASHLREDLGLLQAFASEVEWEDDHVKFPAGTISPVEVLLAPSICFHWYAWLAGEDLGKPKTVTAVGKCFRYESSCLSGLERLWDFSMREVIFVGDAATVADLRMQALDASRQVLEDLDLGFEIATATDPFFIDSFAVQAAFQQGFELKYELLCPLPYKGKSIAIGSVNYHQDFFGRAFGFTHRGSACHTACVGFGLERLALAMLAQHGTEEGGWPSAVKDRLGQCSR